MPPKTFPEQNMKPSSSKILMQYWVEDDKDDNWQKESDELIENMKKNISE